MGTKVFDGTSNRSPSTCPKTPEEAFFASEEAEAVPMESEVFFQSGSKHTTIIRKRVSLTNRIFTVSQFISTTGIKSNNSFRWDE